MKPSRHESEIWARLTASRSLDGLGIGSRDGRIDLSGLIVKTPSVDGQLQASDPASELSGQAFRVQGVTWRSIDFSGSDLRHLRFYDCVIEDCIFDSCNCEDWRIWTSVIERCCFRGANLRYSALGGLVGHNRNTFRKVDFSRSDLRRSAYLAAEFIECDFIDSKISNVNFRQSSFTDCRFKGKLRDVLFSRRWIDADHIPQNQMIRVDMSCAELRFVEFREIDLESALLPKSSNHVILDDFPNTIKHVVDALRPRSDAGSMTMLGYFESMQKWAGKRGVLNKDDVIELSDESTLDFILDVVRSCAG